MRHHAVLEKHRYPDPGFPISARRGSGAGFLAHWHSEVEILLIESGSMTVGVDQDQRLLGPGSLVIAGTNAIHWYDCQELDVRCAFILFRPELIDHASGWPFERVVPGFLAPSAPGADRIAPLFLSLVEELETQRPSYQSVVRGQLMVLCGLLERHLGTAPAAESIHRSAHKQVLRDALDYIHQNYRHPIGLEDAARAVGWSPSHFSRVFSLTVGTSFRSYLNGVRIEAAEGLLRSSARPVTDIAFECGFETLRTFNREFKAKRGITPRQVR